MNTAINQPSPPAYATIARATADAGFTMASEIETCRPLRTLASSKTELAGWTSGEGGATHRVVAGEGRYLFYFAGLGDGDQY